MRHKLKKGELGEGRQKKKGEVGRKEKSMKEKGVVGQNLLNVT